jgi:DNA-binding Lrp family transcriptional regulator
MNLVAAELDKTDAAILEYLRQDARLSFRELGERVNLSSKGNSYLTATRVAISNGSDAIVD